MAPHFGKPCPRGYGRDSELQKTIKRVIVKYIYLYALKHIEDINEHRIKTSFSFFAAGSIMMLSI